MITDNLIKTNDYINKKVNPKKYEKKFKPTDLKKLFSTCPKGKKVCTCKKV